ncbi:MAG: hypothetical protein ACJ8C4_21235 [Gemmataceae bacterium]
MRRAILRSCLFATVMLLPGAIMAADDVQPNAKSQRPEVMAFLRSHVVGKTLLSPSSTFRIDGGKVEVVSEEQMTISGLVETPEGFTFDVTSVSKAMTYDLDKDGKRTLPGHDYSGVRVYRSEVKEMRSTKALAGFTRLISTTAKDKDPTGQFSSIRLSMDGGKLLIKESTVDYVDFIATKGLFKPGALDLFSRFSLDNGKLRLEQSMDLFDVDPVSLKRTPAKDKLPTDVFKESA